jgi:prephenate dehydrogenase
VSAEGDFTPATAAVIGLGLIGGSLARDLARRGVRVLGGDADRASIAAAQADGMVHTALGEELEGIEDADVVILAVPVHAAAAVLRSVARRARQARLITDVGSTKAAIIAAAGALGLAARFVGAHPLAGDHRAGWAAGRPELFTGARVYLCAGAEATPGAVALAHAFWRALGGVPELIDAATHDRQLAWTSHLPQVTATVLALALRDGGHSRAALGPGGHDMTRLAGSSPDIWTGIALENAAALSGALDALGERLARFRHTLDSGDEAALRTLFEAAADWSLPGR